MIVVKLMGGLGNQMFQYAFSRELASLYGEQVLYDFDSYDSDKQRNLALYNMGVCELTDWKSVISDTERAKVLREQKIYRIRQRLIRAIHRSDRLGNKLYQKYLKKGRYYNFDPYYYSLPKLNQENKYAYGYFQGEPYFKHVVEEIKHTYVIPQPVAEEKDTLDEINTHNAVCIHVRVGDYKYAKNKRFDVITPDYIQRGIAYIKEHIYNPSFYVFTNDPETIKSEYHLADVHYVTGFKDYQDMRLMLACKHFIISNSTFSWWASYLAENPEKIIVVPQRWRNNQETEPALMNSEGIEYIKL